MFPYVAPAHSEQRALEPDDPKLATSYNNLALVVRDKGDRDRAKELFGKALTILRAAHGNDHLSIAVAMASIHARNRFRFPIRTMSDMAPMVQKFVRSAVAPKIPPSPNQSRS